MQNTLYRVGNRDIRAVQRIAFRLQCLHIAGHFRRFAQQDIQRQVDRLIVEMVIMQREMLFFGSVANDRIRRAFALTQFIEQRQLVSRDRQHIALTGFVTPDFQRAHARLVAKNVAQFNFPPRPPSLTSSGMALERPPAPTSWINKIGLASPNCQQRSITSRQRRSISGLSR